MKFAMSKESPSSRDGASDTSLVLPDGLEIDTASDDIEVAFKCIYPMSVKVKSTDFSVERVKSSWDSTTNGEFDSGFEMTLDGYELILGAPLAVSATWSLKLPKLQFKIK